MKLLENWRHSPNERLGASTNVSKNQSHAINAGILYHRRVYKTLTAHCMICLPDWKLHIEPWFKRQDGMLRSPDAVLVGTDWALVIEVKKNWKDGRDTKLINEYLPIVANAFNLPTYPLLIVGNCRGYQHRVMTSLDGLLTPHSWRPGDPTPCLLKP